MTKIIAVSDTHGCHNYLEVPKGDVLIHCGDAELDGYSRYHSFLKWFYEQPHKHKLFVPGNHDFHIAQHTFNCLLEFEKYGISVLIDREIIINNTHFYGSPWTPTFMNWAFMKDDEDLAVHWNAIPDATNILITHGPAYGVGDSIEGKRKKFLGSKTLTKRINELPNLTHHLYGHIHTGVPQEGSRAYNCSVLNEQYHLVNKATVLEI